MRKAVLNAVFGKVTSQTHFKSGFNFSGVYGFDYGVLFFEFSMCFERMKTNIQWEKNKALGLF